MSALKRITRGIVRIVEVLPDEDEAIAIALWLALIATTAVLLGGLIYVTVTYLAAVYSGERGILGLLVRVGLLAGVLAGAYALGGNDQAADRAT